MNSFLSQYIKPELMILVPVLYAAGIILKHSLVKSYRIPFILTVIGIVLSTIWVASNVTKFNWQSILASVFTGASQGILVSATSVYLNQLMKQGHEAWVCRQCDMVKKKERHRNSDRNVKNDRKNTISNNFRLEDKQSQSSDQTKNDE
jgi:hypothetical protein